MEVPSTMPPALVAKTMVQVGIAKHHDRYENIFFKAFFAGVMLSFGGVAFFVTCGGATGLQESNPGLVKVLGAFVFPVCLVMILLQGLELLTSNMMVFTMSVLKRAVPWWSLPVNWILVFFGNLTGCLFVSGILVHWGGLLEADPYHSYVLSFALHKVRDPQWHQIFLRGIGCNWLVCVAVWQAAGAKETVSKVLALWPPIWVFVACGFEHVVANMFFIPLAIILGLDMTPAEYIRKSVIPSFLGNVIGALAVALPATYFYLREEAPSRSDNSSKEGSLDLEKGGTTSTVESVDARS